MNITKLKSEIPASFEYEYYDGEGTAKETINLRLARMSFDRSAAKEFRSAMENMAEEPLRITELLAALIAGWDLTEGDGPAAKPYPHTAEAIAALPTDMVGALSECVFKRLFPDPSKAGSSPNGSAQKAKLSAA